MQCCSAAVLQCRTVRAVWEETLWAESGEPLHVAMMRGAVVVMALQGVAVATAAPRAAQCPDQFTLVDAFAAEGKRWIACEDLTKPGGPIVLVPLSTTDPNASPAARDPHATVHPAKPLDADDAQGIEEVWLPKTYEPYTQGTDDEYYLGIGKEKVLAAKWDMLGDAVLHSSCQRSTPTTGLCEPTWAGVERALPVMRYSQGNAKASGNQFMCSPYSPESGVRTFTGSRSASVDATFSDHADDCTDNGFPRPQGYVMNLTAIAAGEPPITNFLNYVNFSGMAEGLVGGVYPNLVFYFPILPQNFSGFGGSRYWTMIASPVPDMQGSREQSVWFRFQQLECGGPDFEPPCKLRGTPQYYDTYWHVAPAPLC